MTNPLFSSYRAGENRVTSSTLAVFERIDLALVTELLAGASERSELVGVTFTNQVVGDGSVPDALISARFEWYFETKTERGVYEHDYGRQQLRAHSRFLEREPGALLFVLTPDPQRPAWLANPDGVADGTRDRIAWLGFRELSDTIRTVLADSVRPLGEQTRFLLTELIALYEADGLLTSDDTVVVAASTAWPEYHRTSAYVCQPDRPFRVGLTHFGFYAEGSIQDRVPAIRDWLPSVTFSHDNAHELRARGEHEVADLIERLLAESTRVEGALYGVMLLTGPDAPATVRLPNRIENDKVTATTGRRFAWTMNQRYVSLDRLRSGVRFTSEL